MPPTRSGVSRRFGSVMLVILALLGVLGAFVAWRGVELLRGVDRDPGAALGALIIGVVLVGVGIGLPIAVRHGQAAEVSRDRLIAARPGEPWAWREDWASGRIAGDSKFGVLAFWLGALAWNAFSWPVAWLFMTEKADQEHIWLVLVFPAGGLLLAGAALLTTLRRRKHGESHFVLETKPGVIGRTLAGHIETRLPVKPAGGVEVRLSCLRRVTTAVRTRNERGARRRWTQTETLWRQHRSVVPSALLHGASGVEIPVSFEIPAGLPGSSDANPNDVVSWLLSVSAALPGLDYTESFEVPVFDRGAAPLTEAEREVLRRQWDVQIDPTVPEHPVARITRGREGTVFEFPPRVTATTGAGGVLLTAGLWGFVWYLAALGLPIAPYVVGGVALLATGGTIVGLFHRSSITIGLGGLRIQHRILGIGWTRRIDAGEVTDVRAGVVGEGKAQSWEVTVHTDDGRSFSAAALLPTQREAEWTAREIQTALEVEAIPTARDRVG